MAYIKSNKINVFPAAFRTGDNIKSAVTSEENITGLKQLSNVAATYNQFYFVNAADELCDLANAISAIIIIKGYRFKITRTDIPGTAKYALIKLKEIDAVTGYVLANQTNPALTTIDTGTGNTAEFNGLQFMATLPVDLSNCYYIQIRDDNGFITQPYKLDASEIKNNDSNDSIIEKFNSSEIVTSDLTATTIQNTTLKTDVITKNNANKIQIDKALKTANNTIDINADVAINGALNIGATGHTGCVTIKSTNTNPITIIGTGNNTITLPSDNTTNADKVNVQNNRVNSWVEVSNTDTANTIVKRNNHDIKTSTVNNMQLTTSIERTTDGVITIADAQTTPVTRHAAMKIGGKLETTATGALISGPINAAIGATGLINIAGQVNIPNTSQLHVNNNTTLEALTGSGAATIKTAGTTTLAADNTDAIDKINVQNNSVNSWVEVSADNSADTIVKRNDNDIKTTTVNDVSIQSTQSRINNQNYGQVNIENFQTSADKKATMILSGRFEVNRDGSIVSAPTGSTEASSNLVDIKGNVTTAVNSELNIAGKLEVDANGALITKSTADSSNKINIGGNIYTPTNSNITLAGVGGLTISNGPVLALTTGDVDAVINTNGTTTLPSDNITDIDKINVQNNSVNSWVEVSKYNTADTVVKRNVNNIETGTINNIEITEVLDEVLDQDSREIGFGKFVMLDDCEDAAYHAGIHIGGKLQITDTGSLTCGPITARDFGDDNLINIQGNLNLPSSDCSLTLGDSSKVALYSSSASAVGSLKIKSNTTLDLPGNITSSQTVGTPYVWTQQRTSSNVITSNWTDLNGYIFGSGDKRFRSDIATNGLDFFADSFAEEAMARISPQFISAAHGSTLCIEGRSSVFIPNLHFGYLTEPPTADNPISGSIRPVLLNANPYTPSSVTQYRGYIYMWYSGPED